MKIQLAGESGDDDALGQSGGKLGAAGTIEVNRISEVGFPEFQSEGLEGVKGHAVL